jgi:hypothetical protein
LVYNIEQEVSGHKEDRQTDTQTDLGVVEAVRAKRKRPSVGQDVDKEFERAERASPGAGVSAVGAPRRQQEDSFRERVVEASRPSRNEVEVPATQDREERQQ